MHASTPFLKKTSLAAALASFFAGQALASFNPDAYTYTMHPVAVDGVPMVKLRVYDAGQTIIVNPEDAGAEDEHGDSNPVTRTLTEDDLVNTAGAMRYIREVFGAPVAAPEVETFLNGEDQASFGSRVPGSQPGVRPTSLATWFDVDPHAGPATELPIGLFTLGVLGSKDGGVAKPLPDKGEGAAMSAVISHEMMHGLGITTDVDDGEDEEGDIVFYLPKANTTFSSHLYDVEGKRLLDTGGPDDDPIVFEMADPSVLDPLNPDIVEATDAVCSDASPFLMYDYDDARAFESFNGAFFWGEHVGEVLTLGTQTAAIAMPDGALAGLLVKGVPINGYEQETDPQGNAVLMPELSHIELQNSMMSHQNYRNWGVFMEAELAILQDIGFTIDRKKFFGLSVYNSNVAFENALDWESAQNRAIGLHVYGSGNEITQSGNISASGDYAYGARIDGVDNKLTVGEGTTVAAEGAEGAGVLVSYGNGHELNVRGDVRASGRGGTALRLDFGGNLLGDATEYRGSYFQVHKSELFGIFTDVDDGVTPALYGPLVKRIDLTGGLKGEKAAIYIADNAFVKEINVMAGASLEGDILSEWSPVANRYGKYGLFMHLFKPEEENGVTVLSFGRAADGDGKATDSPDEAFEMTYSGAITGPDGLALQLAGGTLAYKGTARVLVFAGEDDTTLKLDGATLAAQSIASSSKITLSGQSALCFSDESQVELEDAGIRVATLEVASGADATVKAGKAVVEIGTLGNAGAVLFATESKPVEIGSYSGEGASSLTLELAGEALESLAAGSASQMASEAASRFLTIETNVNDSDLNVVLAEGEVTGRIEAVVDAQGGVVAASEKPNSTAEALTQIAAVGFQALRSQMNDLDKRMGDLRSMPAASGAWARVLASQTKYKGQHTDHRMLQVGADVRHGGYFAGVTASATKGDGKLRDGSSDTKNYAVGLYGGWLADNGLFFDATLKHQRLKTDFAFRAAERATSGSYDRNGMSVSLEAGWRFEPEVCPGYLEVQGEFTYGRLASENFVTNRGVSVRMDASHTKVARLGLAAGYKLPEGKGSLYAKASVLHEFDGKAGVRMGKDGVSRAYSEKLDGTWGEFALGGTFNLGGKVSAYAELETTAGGKVRTTYQFVGGLRYAF